MLGRTGCVDYVGKLAKFWPIRAIGQRERERDRERERERGI